MQKEHYVHKTLYYSRLIYKQSIVIFIIICRHKKMSQTKTALYILLIVYLATPLQCYNILGIFIHPGKSHFDMFYPLMHGLAQNGHNITVISHFPDKNPLPNYRDIVLEGLDDISLNNGVDLSVSILCINVQEKYLFYSLKTG